MIQLIEKGLEQILNNIKAGTSIISEQEQLELINFLTKINAEELSKTESAHYINVSKSTFDNYVKKGLIPEGTKRSGFKELSWKKSDLEKFLKK